MAFGPELPRILSGSAPALAIGDLKTFGLRVPQNAQGDRVTRAFEALYQGSATGLLASSSEEGFEAARQLKAADPTQYLEHGATRRPNGKIGHSLLEIAQLIKADISLQWPLADARPAGTPTSTRERVKAEFVGPAQASSATPWRPSATDMGDRMTQVEGQYLTMSEFGRTIHENGS